MKEVISRIFWVFLNVSPRRHLSRPSLISISFHRTIIMKKAVVVTLGISLLVTVSYRDILSPWLYSLNGREDNHLHQRELHLTSEGESDHSRMAAGKVGSSNKRTNKNFVKGSNNNNSQKTKSNETPTRTPPSLLVPRPRPIMHTFFTELVPENPNDPHQITAGMTPAAHNSMLLVWQKSWQQAGWDTRILTMEDAMEHVDFDALRAKIEQQFRMNDYDKARYYRWIAMAAAGGGWMSDYDTLPLHNFTNQAHPLPMHGALVVYEHHVPSLLSGNATEWTRMIHLLLNHAIVETKKTDADKTPTPSDMFGLMALKKQNDQQDAQYVTRSEVLGLHELPDGIKWTKEHCQATTATNMRAAHFSHYFIATKWLPTHREHDMEDRPFIASKWLHEWLRDCGRQQYQELGWTSTNSATK